jgi:hypothetical protein
MNDTSLSVSLDAANTTLPVSRRDALRASAAIGSSVAAALALGSIPVALAVLARDAAAQAPVSVRGVLEFAYLLENLEAEFYKAVLGESATAAQNTAFATVRTQVSTDAALLASLRQIRKHEVAHVAFLKAAITALGGTPATYTGAEFDFTGGNGTGTGPFAAAKSDPVYLLALAQIFEDTGVRAYKGQLDQLISDKPTLTAALKIHSVEARHAARIRELRGLGGVKPWIINVDMLTASNPAVATITFPNLTGAALTAANAVVARAYIRENNTIHKSIDMAGLGSNTGGSAGVTEAFDEPLTYDDVIFIIKDFVIGTTP